MKPQNNRFVFSSEKPDEEISLEREDEEISEKCQKEKEDVMCVREKEINEHLLNGTLNRKLWAYYWMTFIIMCVKLNLIKILQS